METPFYPPPGPFVGGQQPYAPFTSIPTSGPAPQNPPITGARVPGAILLHWIDYDPTPRQLGYRGIPTSGPAPQNPPVIGSRYPLAISISWEMPAELPRQRAGIAQFGAASSFVPAASSLALLTVLTSWADPGWSSLVSRSTLLQGASPPDAPPILGAKTPLAVLIAGLPPDPTPPVYPRVFISGPTPQAPPTARRNAAFDALAWYGLDYQLPPMPQAVPTSGPSLPPRLGRYAAFDALAWIEQDRPSLLARNLTPPSGITNPPPLRQNAAFDSLPWYGLDQQTPAARNLAPPSAPSLPPRLQTNAALGVMPWYGLDIERQARRTGVPVSSPDNPPRTSLTAFLNVLMWYELVDPPVFEPATWPISGEIATNPPLLNRSALLSILDNYDITPYVLPRVPTHLNQPKVVCVASSVEQVIEVSTGVEQVISVSSQVIQC